MDFKAVKGTRDFYPDRMRIRRYIVDTWRAVSLRNGFEEYDAPLLEYLDLFTVKSGEEIASQLFSFTDRGGRDLAIRPEITPSLARMVSAKINSMPRPIKWFSVPRLCRAEKPQRGRLREFFQWNVDIIDENSVEADAECIYILTDFFRETGLAPADITVRVGSRPVVTALLQSHGVDPANMEQAMLALDKRRKIPDAAFAELMETIQIRGSDLRDICDFMDAPGDSALDRMQTIAVDETHVRELTSLRDTLADMGGADYVAFDWHIVRGLAYYTGIVYEAVAEGERAVAGGGRYDGLLETVGGPAVGAVGFGMGDVVLGLLLDEKSLLPEEICGPKLDIFVVDGTGDNRQRIFAAVDRLRRMGIAADFSFNRARVGRQLKEADRRNTGRAVIIDGDTCRVKDMSSGEQSESMPVERFFSDIEGAV